MDMTDGALTPFVAHRSFQSDFSTAGRDVSNGVLKETGGSGTVGVIALQPGLALDTPRYEPALKILARADGAGIAGGQFIEPFGSDGAVHGE